MNGRSVEYSRLDYTLKITCLKSIKLMQNNYPFPLKSSILICLAIVISSCSDSQPQLSHNPELIGGCEGCEAILEYGDRELKPVDTLPDFNENGTRIKLSGTIYEPDGETPAEGVILYVYHTDQQGIYSAKQNATGWGQKHGYIREWLKTGEDGYYGFYTLKPGAYPSGIEPPHIHIIAMEPDGKYYWLNGFHFSGDTLLTEEEINPDNPRGGSGFVSLEMNSKGILEGHRDIFLGKNIPNYPED